MLPDAEAEFSADEKEGYLIMESDALEDWNVNVTYRTQNLQKNMKSRAQRYSEQIFPRTMMMLRNGVMWLCLDSKLKCTTPYGTAEQPADKMDDPYELGLRVEQ